MDMEFVAFLLNFLFINSVFPKLTCTRSLYIKLGAKLKKHKLKEIRTTLKIISLQNECQVLSQISTENQLKQTSGKFTITPTLRARILGPIPD